MASSARDARPLKILRGHSPKEEGNITSGCILLASVDFQLAHVATHVAVVNVRRDDLEVFMTIELPVWSALNLAMHHRVRCDDLGQGSHSGWKVNSVHHALRDSP